MLLLLVAINVAVVGAEVGFLAQGLARSRTDEASQYAAEFVSLLRGEVQPGRGLNVKRLLEWSKWGRFTDAIILDGNLVKSREGRISPAGVALSPMGGAHRPADFDYQSVYAAIDLATTRGESIDDVEGGRVVPIEHAQGTWGACWFQVARTVDRADLVLRYFLPIFLVSTVLLSAGTFFGLRRFVLAPVEQLARASRQVAQGDLSVRLPEPRYTDEISELMRAFNAMTDEVEGFNARLAREVRIATDHARQAESAAMTQRRLAATGELAAGMAHEINNPLGGLLNAVEALNRGDLAESRRVQYLALLQLGLERIRVTVGQLLRFTPRGSSTAPVQILSPVRDALALVRHRAEGQGVRLLLGDGTSWADSDHLTPELERGFAALPALEGEAHELGQALLNLLVNAIDAVEPLERGAGRIEVALTYSAEGALGEHIEVAVSDNGPGVPEDELARLCDLFYTTKEVGRGSGLGLAIVHNVVSSHGGTLELSSPPGSGLRVLLRIPLRHGSGGGGSDAEPHEHRDQPDRGTAT